MISGFLAVVVALLAKGIMYALITLGLIIAIQQLEAHVLQPFVMGRAVSLHPLAVVLGIAAGGVLAGIVGALLAVPAIAFLTMRCGCCSPVSRRPSWRRRSPERAKVIEAEADDVELAKKTD